MQKTTKRKTSKRLSEKPRAELYDILVYWSDADDCYLAECPVLDGCRTHGDTPEEAAKNGRECIELWLASAHESGQHIPLPPSHYSGSLSLRLPSSLHQRVAKQAQLEGVSLNQWIAACLAERHGLASPSA